MTLPGEPPKCQSCKAAPATVQILDLEKGSIVDARFLCDSCAAQMTSSGQSKHQSIQLSSEIIESLLGGAQESESSLDPNDIACPGCGLTAAEFRLRGRLGCPRCYEVFRIAVLPLLERVHDATCHRGRFPGRVQADIPPPRVNIADLRHRLRRAIESEQYEEAARLRDALEQVKDDEGSPS